jgi:hypothetical protein
MVKKLHTLYGTLRFKTEMKSIFNFYKILMEATGKFTLREISSSLPRILFGGLFLAEPVLRQ